VENRFQRLPFKCNLQRYNTELQRDLEEANTRREEEAQRRNDRGHGGALQVESS
jgi:hypothetical protein